MTTIHSVSVINSLWTKDIEYMTTIHPVTVINSQWVYDWYRVYGSHILYILGSQWVYDWYRVYGSHILYILGSQWVYDCYRVYGRNSLWTKDIEYMTAIHLSPQHTGFLRYIDVWKVNNRTMTVNLKVFSLNNFWFNFTVSNSNFLFFKLVNLMLHPSFNMCKRLLWYMLVAQAILYLLNPVPCQTKNNFSLFILYYVYTTNCFYLTGKMLGKAINSIRVYVLLKLSVSRNISY
jgi:hypothetical protein